MSVAVPNMNVRVAAGRDPSDNYLNHSRGLLSWIFTLDHKRIAIMYMVFILANYLLAGIFAMLLRIELLSPKPWMLADPEATKQLYNNMFTLHGAMMIFLFVIPAIPAIFGNFVLPLMLGAKDVAFPRLNLLSLWCYGMGGLFFVYVLFSGVYHAATGNTLPGGFGLDTGWTFYTPYSTNEASGGNVVAATTGAFIIGFSSILTGINFVASIHTLRPKAMGWFKMPLFLWSLYATSILQILATPVLAITLLLLIAEKTLHIGIFAWKLGGDPVLYQHFFWFYSHPAVYIMILPAMGVMSEVMPVFCRKHIFGYAFIACSSVGLAMLSFFVWGHHMFVSGQSALVNSIFSLLTFSVAIPSAVKVFNWTATMYKSDIRFNAALCFALGFIMVFTAGGLTGMFLGSLQTNVPLHDTYFVVAHFHYVMMGSTVFAFLAGMYYWFPKIFGKTCNDKVGCWAAVIIFVGFNLTFFPQFIMGTKGMPRRWATYPPEFQIYHIISTIGAFVMAAGLFTVAYNWVAGLLIGPPAPPNPWGGNTLEWATTSPPPHDNFAQTPTPGDPYHLADWQYVNEKQGWVKSPATSEGPQA